MTLTKFKLWIRNLLNVHGPANKFQLQIFIWIKCLRDVSIEWHNPVCLLCVLTVLFVQSFSRMLAHLFRTRFTVTPCVVAVYSLFPTSLPGEYCLAVCFVCEKILRVENKESFYYSKNVSPKSRCTSVRVLSIICRHHSCVRACVCVFAFVVPRNFNDDLILVAFSRETQFRNTSFNAKNGKSHHPARKRK